MAVIEAAAKIVVVALPGITSVASMLASAVVSNSSVVSHVRKPMIMGVESPNAKVARLTGAAKVPAMRGLTKMPVVAVSVPDASVVTENSE